MVRVLRKILKNWQSTIGYVPQDIYLLDDTIKNNITFNEETVDDNQLKKILKLARLNQFIESLLMDLRRTLVRGSAKFLGVRGRGSQV